MADEKRFCPIMSGVVPHKEPGPAAGLQLETGHPVKIFCLKEECALWDPLLKCCSHVSHLVEGRVNVRDIVAGIVAGIEQDQERATVLLDDARRDARSVLESTPYPCGSPLEKPLRRVGELEGKIDVMGQVAVILRRRFMI